MTSAVEESRGRSLEHWTPPYQGASAHGPVLHDLLQGPHHPEPFDVRVRALDGSHRALDVARWHGPARGADLGVIDRVVGSALDVGCGPGRIAAALAGRDEPVLGIDVAPVAVRLTLQAGAPALLLDVFGEVPGTWCNVLLMDGNVGIGGDPVRLLRRLRDLLTPDGRVVVELDPPGGGLVRGHVRLERGSEVGPLFPWAQVSVDALAEVAQAAAMTVLEQWSETDDDSGTGTVRWFGVLGRG